MPTTVDGDDPFDTGIDWNQAVQYLNENESSITQSHKSIGNDVMVDRFREREKIRSNGSVNRQMQSTMIPNITSRPSLASVSSTSHNSAERVPLTERGSQSASNHNDSKLQPAKKTQQSHVNGLSSLRPESWSNETSTRTKHSSQELSNQKVAAQPASISSQDSLQASLPMPLRFDPKVVEAVQDEHRQVLVQNANLSSPLLNGWTLFPHQKRAILVGLLMRRVILALDMGMGKTLIGCVWSKAFVKVFEGVKVIVICPVSLKETWQRTAVESTGLKVQFDGSEPDAESSVTIATWSKIPRVDQIKSENYVVIADEAHSMQNVKAARTQESLKLMLHAKCIGVLLLSGTPMKNGKPGNLFPLLKAVRHPFGNNQRAFEAHFCDGRQVSFGRGQAVWQANGSSNLKQLHDLTKTHMLHLTKETCLKDLPPLTRVRKHVPVSSRSTLQHNQALQFLAKVYQRADSSTESNQDAILGAVQSLRVVDSLAKVDAAVEVAKKVLEKEEAIVIFTSFQRVAGLVHQKLREAGWDGELLTGETPAAKRQGLVDNFQNGLKPVFVCTFGAGGVGLTLTAAHTVVLIDRPWTPGDAHQAEDRVRRIGQTKPVTSIWISSFELDSQIDAMLEQKSQTSLAVLNDDAIGDKVSSAAPKLSILKMLKALLPTPASNHHPSPSSSNASTGLYQTSLLQFSQAPT